MFEYPLGIFIVKMGVFFLIGMATWRLSSLLANEPGPFKIFERLRNWLAKSKFFVFKELSVGLECTWCNSVWIGMVLSFIVATNIIEWFVVSLALSMFSIAVNRKLGS